jgi:two-component system, chemotaxis family, sensor kinase Cph1
VGGILEIEPALNQAGASMTSLDLISQVKNRIATLTDPELASADLSLTNCDREPIQISNAIQDHGLLLTFTEADLVVLQISQNSAAFLGKTPTELLGKPLSIILKEEQIEAIRDCLNEGFENVNPLRLVLPVGNEFRSFEGIVHRIDGIAVLELERSIPRQAVSFFDFYKFVKSPIDRIQRTQSLAEISQQAVTEIRNITGFDRVMLYRFDSDGSGHVIAENKSEDSESFLGLHYPASDIPKQARELYRLNLLRIIPDALYSPVSLEPALNPVTGKPLDLSLSVLRSVSPIHNEYLANMGVRASMSISLLRDRQLWGLISCHHLTPRRLSYETRTICEFLGQVISSELGSKADGEDLDYKLNLQRVHARFLNTITNCQTLGDGLAQNPSDLINLLGAHGVIFCEGGKISAFGNTPPQTTVAGLLEWIDRHINEDSIYITTTLVTEYPEFLAYKDVASGLLALRISRAQQTYLLWFRAEVLQTIDWSGEPQKQMEVNVDGSLRISPRKSFDLWKETVQLTSLPWKTCEIEAALELRSRIIGIVLQKADELALLNTELARSNIELDSFAYVASHDLKEPLRGIHNYSTFLIEDYGDRLGIDGTEKLATLIRLTQRMENLINSLLHYSRCGRAELLFQPVDLGEVISSVIETIEISRPASADFQIPRPLPIVQCDRTQVIELFNNLISNAIEYNNRTQKTVEIGYISSEQLDPELAKSLGLNHSQLVFFVKDNGIGIRAKHLEIIFKIFKRLHPANKYGGGTGAGLTIARKIVERHGGKIAVESTVGVGSTFYFTLGAT